MGNVLSLSKAFVSQPRRQGNLDSKARPIGLGSTGLLVTAQGPADSPGLTFLKAAPKLQAKGPLAVEKQLECFARPIHPKSSKCFVLRNLYPMGCLRPSVRKSVIPSRNVQQRCIAHIQLLDSLVHCQCLTHQCLGSTVTCLRNVGPSIWLVRGFLQYVQAARVLFGLDNPRGRPSVVTNSYCLVPVPVGSLISHRDDPWVDAKIGGRPISTSHQAPALVQETGGTVHRRAGPRDFHR